MAPFRVIVALRDEAQNALSLSADGNQSYAKIEFAVTWATRHLLIHVKCYARRRLDNTHAGPDLPARVGPIFHDHIYI